MTKVKKAEIKVVGAGVNGSAICSILSPEGQKIVTDKSVEIIAQEIKLRYPEIASKIKVASRSFDVDRVTEIDLIQLPPSIKDDLIKKIA